MSVSDAVTYSDSLTNIVTGISPFYGSVAGNDVVTITGSGFGVDATKVSVSIDGVACAVGSSISNTQITCTTGAKTTNVA